MNKLLVCALLPMAASAGEVGLTTPSTSAINPPVVTSGCTAYTATIAPYRTTVTGFSADGNYVQGSVASHYTCGHSGRGSTVHTVYLCTILTWDLSGNLVSAATAPSLTSVNCPAVTLEQPPNTPPGGTVTGNSFVNAGGYVAETVLTQVCGSVACPATWLYYAPTLVTP